MARLAFLLFWTLECRALGVVLLVTVVLASALKLTYQLALVVGVVGMPHLTVPIRRVVEGVRVG